jgi:hypothetical protein
LPTPNEGSGTTAPPVLTPIEPPPPPDFRIDLVRSVSGFTASGVVPPSVRTSLEATFGAEDIGSGLQVANGVSVPDGLGRG